MARKLPKKLLSIFRPALLRSESADEYEIHRKRIFRELCPRTYIGSLLVDEYVRSSWELLRLHGIGPAMIDGAYLPALQNILAMTSKIGGIDTDALAPTYFSDSVSKKQADERLAKNGFDDMSIVAEAVRLRAPCLETHDKLVSAVDKRARQALQSYFDYCAGMAITIPATSRGLENDPCETSHSMTIENDEPESA